MAGDRTVRASPRRIAAAQRAGVRPDAPLLRLGVVASALIVGVGLVGEMARHSASAALGSELDPSLFERLAWSWAGLMGVLGIAVVGAAVLSRRAGPVRRDPSLPERSVGAAGWVRGIIATLGIAAVLYAVRGVLAAAARGTDASQAGLTALYGGWAIRVLTVIAGVAVTLGVAQLGGALWRRRRDLAQTPDQARRMAREASRR